MALVQCTPPGQRTGSKPSLVSPSEVAQSFLLHHPFLSLPVFPEGHGAGGPKCRKPQRANAIGASLCSTETFLKIKVFLFLQKFVQKLLEREREGGGYRREEMRLRLMSLQTASCLSRTVGHLHYSLCWGLWRSNELRVSVISQPN